MTTQTTLSRISSGRKSFWLLYWRSLRVIPNSVHPLESVPRSWVEFQHQHEAMGYPSVMTTVDSQCFKWTECWNNLWNFKLNLGCLTFIQTVGHHILIFAHGARKIRSFLRHMLSWWCSRWQHVCCKLMRWYVLHIQEMKLESDQFTIFLESCLPVNKKWN